VLSTRTAAHAGTICDAGIPLDAVAAVAAAPPRLDDWQTREHTRKLGRELRRAAVASSPSADRAGNVRRRLDPPVDLFTEAAPAITTATAMPAASAARRAQGGQLAAWMFVATGGTALSCGLGAIVWSLTAGRADYWRPALGLTLAGQGLLILGLVLVVSRLWRNSRHVSGKLQEAQQQLGQLQRTADALAGQRGSAGAFYADLARGGSPAMLVANLRGQVDQLATRLGG
jgi:hypothetical protein